LKAAGKAHSLTGELVDIGCVGLASITTEIAKSAVIGNDEDNVGFCGGRNCENENEKEAHLTLDW
jgi:hypothetical protein